MATATLTIPANQSQSNAVSIASVDVVALIAPAGWTAGVRLTFLLSTDATNFYPLSDVSSELYHSIPVAPGSWMPIGSSTFPKNISLKLQSGYPNAPVRQPTDQVFTLVTT